MISIIDYGAGNLRSVKRAFEKLGFNPLITSKHQDIAKSNFLILPGVGAFGSAIDNLKQLNLINPIKDYIASGRPFLGICIGLQVLFDSSEEAPGVEGLGVFSGTVKKFNFSNLSVDNRLKIPHMGWNQLQYKLPEPIFSELPDNPFVYFVHSYFVAPTDKSIIVATTEYGFPFAAAIKKDNVTAVQFHPEKSGQIGLQILRNIVNIHQDLEDF